MILIEEIFKDLKKIGWLNEIKKLGSLKDRRIKVDEIIRKANLLKGEITELTLDEQLRLDYLIQQEGVDLDLCPDYYIFFSNKNNKFHHLCHRDGQRTRCRGSKNICSSNIKIGLIPIAKYDCSEEGARYAWSLDGKSSPFVESGSFKRRTKLGKGTRDEDIAAYTISVSKGCILSKNNAQCEFCVTGNSVLFERLLTAQEIALQNIFLVLDDKEANSLNKSREFAYMGQGEPGLNYPAVKKAIIGTDLIMKKLGIKTFRHIFATSGIPDAIYQLGRDIKNGDYGESEVLLHLSLHAGDKRSSIMPINKQYPLEEVVEASYNYYDNTRQQISINFMLLKNVALKDGTKFNNVSVSALGSLLSLLDPKVHKIVLCEFNCGPKVCRSEEISKEDVNPLEDLLKSKKFLYKKFIAFGKDNKLACGLLGGLAEYNLDRKTILESLIKANNLIAEHIK